MNEGKLYSVYRHWLHGVYFKSTHFLQGLNVVFCCFIFSSILRLNVKQIIWVILVTKAIRQVNILNKNRNLKFCFSTPEIVAASLLLGDSKLQTSFYLHDVKKEDRLTRWLHRCPAQKKSFASRSPFYLHLSLTVIILAADKCLKCKCGDFISMTCPLVLSRRRDECFNYVVMRVWCMWYLHGWLDGFLSEATRCGLHVCSSRGADWAIATHSSMLKEE